MTFANLASKVEEYPAGKVNWCRLLFRPGSVRDLQFIVIHQSVSDVNLNFTGKSVLAIGTY